MRRPIITIICCTAIAGILSGCYVVPVLPDGQAAYPYPYSYPPSPPAPPAAAAGPQSTVLQARLYPANDVAGRTGILSGVVTNLMNGRGRFELQFKGETLIGEATRVDNDQRRGVANALGAGGTYMSCEYQMQSPRQGAGTCTLSNGAKYQAHLGL
jgi:hypothetical protein